MKKLSAILLAAIMIFSLAACGGKGESNGNVTTSPTKNTSTTKRETEKTTQDKNDSNEKFDYTAIPDTVNSQNGKYELAFVTDLGQLLDKSFNQGTWEGLKRYAYENGLTYKYYQPANGNRATDEDRYNAMKAAADAGAKVVICAGYLQGEALRRAAKEYPEVKFVFIDGSIVRESDSEEAAALKNVAAIDYNEEQSGFLAGYAAVAEGYTKLGFTGGGGGTNPSCNRFAYGYAQGAESAAKKLGKNIELKLSWEYGASFAPSAELQTMLNGWYAEGTQVIFCCGGPMCQSAFAAASANDGAVIGVDVDQSEDSDTVITSAMKGLRESVALVLDKVKKGEWDELGGKLTTLGAKDGAVSLPADNWKLKNFTVDEYKAIYEKLKKGDITVDRDTEMLRPESFENVKLVIV